MSSTIDTFGCPILAAFVAGQAVNCGGERGIVVDVKGADLSRVRVLVRFASGIKRWRSGRRVFLGDYRGE